MSEFTTLLAQRFIARRDVKAVQHDGGSYGPVDQPWQMADLDAHLDGSTTFGHYLLDAEDRCKLFAFDCDLIAGPGVGYVLPTSEALATMTDAEYDASVTEIAIPDVRAEWADRNSPMRPFLKHQMRTLAETLSYRIRETLGIPVACAYSGNKGVHVYGFTGLVQAAEAREAAMIVLDSFGGRFAQHGKSHFRDTDPDPYEGYANFEIELFPKQDHVGEGGYGNLMRLPLGVNRKRPTDPTFFLDQTAPHATLAPHPNPVELLTDGNPWAVSL